MQIPSGAYWAIDYHFDWIAGAIMQFSNVEANGRFSNTPVSDRLDRLIQGNQEDTDLLVAFGNNIILMECKAAGGWNKKQLISKAKRIKLLKQFAEPLNDSVRIFPVLLSPDKPSEEVKKVAGIDSWPWIELADYGQESFSAVQRCGVNEKADRDGDDWHIIKA